MSGKVAAGTAGDVAATEALAGAFVAAKEACGAVEDRAACQAELAETGREGGRRRRRRDCVFRPRGSGEARPRQVRGRGVNGRGGDERRAFDLLKLLEH